MTRGAGGESPANVTTYLKGIDYPAKKDQLVQHAQQMDAQQQLQRLLAGSRESEMVEFK
ncbi:DUF2795 domain-containing protein [Stutzerimonas stutzeri]|uniref:DUF2795 domain-containing protein n=1 Tax=Stutzerimonas stutzeri TaxID=316 RepID=UPI00210F0D10|nr:DUF2795 domain-containing protein [Stutzerimonas stutzeri]MCQ4323203.1 DUF2795 domain-containing protein [Stutzerimonas stutzeri]